MASFVCNDWKGYLYISLADLCFKIALGLLINNRSNFREERIILRKIAANYRSKICSDSSRKANYHLKNRVDQDNRCHENAGKYRIERNFFKKPRKARNFVEIRLHYFCTILYSDNSSKKKGFARKTNLNDFMSCRAS